MGNLGEREVEMGIKKGGIWELGKFGGELGRIKEMGLLGIWRFWIW